MAPSGAETISRNTTWTTRQVLSSSALNAEFDNILSFINTAKIDADNIKDSIDLLLGVVTGTSFTATGAVQGATVTATTSSALGVATGTSLATTSFGKFSGEVGVTGQFNAYGIAKVVGALTAQSVAATAAVTGASASFTGTAAADILTATTSAALGAITGSSVIVTGAVQGATVTGTTSITEAGTALASKYLGIAAKAADSSLLNGVADATAATASTIAKRDTSADLTARRFVSGLATGTSPLSVTSTTVNTNLNADLLDGNEASAFLGASATAANAIELMGLSYLQYLPSKATIENLLGASAANLNGGIAVDTDKFTVADGTGVFTSGSGTITTTGAFTTAGAATMVDTDVANPVTSYAPATAYGSIGAESGTTGGLSLNGFSDSSTSNGTIVRGIIGAADPADNTSAIWCAGSKSNGGTGVAALGALERVFEIDNFSTVLAIINGSGNMTLGATDLASTTSKLYVDGAQYLAGALTVQPSAAATDGKVWVYSTKAYNASPTSSLSFGFQSHSTPTTINGYARIDGGKENTSDGDHKSFLSFNLSDATGSPFEAGRFGTTGLVFTQQPSVASDVALHVNSSTGLVTKVSSSRRYKDNIRPMKFSWDTFMKLKPSTFDEKRVDGRKDLDGLIAEETIGLYPGECTVDNIGRPESVDYSRMVSPTIAAVQDLKRTVTIMMRLIGVLLLAVLFLFILLFRTWERLGWMK